MKKIVAVLFFLLTVTVLAEPSDGEVEESPSSKHGLLMQRDLADFGDSAVTVDEGDVQLETGFLMVRENGQNVTTFPTIMRFGISPTVEMRIGSDLMTLRNPGLRTGGKFTLGSKMSLFQDDDTALALMAEVEIPVGPEDLRGTVDPGLSLFFEHMLVGDLEIGIYGGMYMTGKRGERIGQFYSSVVLEHPIVPDRLYANVECWVEGPTERGEGRQAIIEGHAHY